MFLKTVWGRTIPVSLFFLFLSACAGGGNAVYSSRDANVSDRSDDSDPEEEIGSLHEVFGGKDKGAKSTGRMDGVEYLIGQDLALHGASPAGREIPKLQSTFESSTGGGWPRGGWRPRKGNDIPMVHNAQVERWIKAFTGPLRKNFSRWLQRASRYGPMIEDILREYRLPKDLIYLAMIESGFNLNAYSHAHAAGPWQFIRSTGKLYGLNAGPYVDERRDLEKATRAAAEHLRDLYRMYDDWYLAFAAYNAGAGAVNRAIRNSGTNDFWKIASAKGKKRTLRQETKDYVPRILAAATIAKNYRKYGFSGSLFDEEGLDSETATVPDATDLAVIAECAGASLTEIRELNPSLVMGITPPGQKFTVNVPRGTGGIFRANYARVPKEDRIRFVYHKVKRKETLNGIARRYGVSKTLLAKANGLSTKTNTLRSGALLMIPKKGAPFKLAPVQPGEEVLTASSAPALSSAPAVSYHVRRGDTWGGIAQKYGLTVTELKELNGAGRKTVLKAGATLKVAREAEAASTDVASIISDVNTITADRPEEGHADSNVIAGDAATAPDKEAVLKDEPPVFAPTETTKPQAAPQTVSPPAAEEPEQKKLYTVREGDSLWSIAQSTGVTVSDLVRWNPRFADGETIKPNQSIRLGAMAETSPPVTVKPQTTKSSAGKTAKKSSAKASTVAARPPAETQSVIVHKVRRGDTLSGLARKYGVSVAQIKNWNRLSRDTLMLNQKIKIYTNAPSASAKKVASSG